MNPEILIIILGLLLSAACGALVMAAYALFLMAAATWGDSDEHDDRGPSAPLPTPTDPPSCKKLPLSASPTSTFTSAPAGALADFAPMPIPPAPAIPSPSAAPRTEPPASSGTPASSAPPSAAPERRATVLLDGGPFDGLALKVDPSQPILRVKSTFHGLHRYLPTDRFDLNRRVCIHGGPEDPLS